MGVCWVTILTPASDKLLVSLVGMVCTSFIYLFLAINIF